MKAVTAYATSAIGFYAWIGFVLCILAIPGLAVESIAGKPNLFAVIVGIGEYDDPRIWLARNATDDARDVQTFIEEQQSTKKLFRRIYLKALHDSNATKNEVKRTLKRLLTSAQRDDVVIVYLAGHGTWASNDRHYFLPYDADKDDIERTAIAMDDPDLFRDVVSERILLVADTCNSGGFLPTMGDGVKRRSSQLPQIPAQARGRFVMSAAGPDEDALSSPDFRRGLFTYYFLKGLRGEALEKSKGRRITVQALFDYVREHTQRAARKLGATQTPCLFDPAKLASTTPVYLTERFEKELNIPVKLFCEDEGNLKEITNESILKSGQHFGIAFRPDADCYVHIFCWDTSGQVRRLFPNQKLSEGTGAVRQGETVWLPSKGGKHWYVLDSRPGTETIYFVATRHRNHKLEDLYEKLEALAPEERLGEKGRKLAASIEREMNLMRDADIEQAARGIPPERSGSLFDIFERRLRVEGAEAVRKWKFKHLDR